MPWWAVDWSSLSAWSWLATIASAVLALNVTYLIRYSSVQRLGNTRTAIYSNMVPVAAMLMAWIALGERIEAAKWVGAAAVIGGFPSRARGKRVTRPDAPPEE